LAFVPLPGAFFFFGGVSSFQVWKGLGACVYFTWGYEYGEIWDWMCVCV
jgi:hypothetical protein